MTGPKLNDGATVAGERVGTRATAKYVRSSASKARVVLDLIRGLDVRRASEVLRFSERGISSDIAKVLDSAVANAIHNDAQDADELYVVACYADEGPTLKRFRPRARGRATRIRKRTCHITVIVARMSDDRIALLEARAEGRGGRTSAASRRDRVERSRRRAQSIKEGATADTADDVIDESDEVEATDVLDEDEVALEDEVVVEDDVADEDEVAEDEVAEDDDVATEESSEYPGSVVAPEDGSMPAGHEIKGNANSMKYHTPDSPYYDITIADVWFDTAESAEAAGFEAPAAAATADETTDDETTDDAESDEEQN
jgi:large subunit ribosomal protein L22